MCTITASFFKIFLLLFPLGPAKGLILKEKISLLTQLYSSKAALPLHDLFVKGDLFSWVNDLPLGDEDDGEKECVIENLKKSGSALILGIIFVAYQTRFSGLHFRRLFNCAHQCDCDLWRCLEEQNCKATRWRPDGWCKVRGLVPRNHHPGSISSTPSKIQNPFYIWVGL